jgi:hypothetical protein
MSLMNNDELKTRMKLMSEAIPNDADKILGKHLTSKDFIAPTDQTKVQFKIAAELELLNMNIMSVWWLLGEMVLRMPEQEKKETEGG